MSWAVVRSRVAREELDNLWLRIAEHDLSAADRYIDQIDDAVRKLESYPRLGRDRSDIRAGLRGLIVRNILILYQIDDAQNRVEVIRAVDGRRDLSALF